jgi:hypothetical protein
MARRTTTYAIRLAVEGGGQVRAELVSVGESGEQSLKRIETAGDRASGGLKGLGRQASAKGTQRISDDPMAFTPVSTNCRPSLPIRRGPRMQSTSKSALAPDHA